MRDYIHVMDLAESHLLAAKYLIAQPNGCFDAIHLGSGKPYSNFEVCRAVEEHLGRKLEYEVDKARVGDPPALYADVTKAKRLLGFSTKYSELEDIVSSAWKWHESHPDGFK